jgi:alpha-ketoglutarate-dependent taurine dioxygenase
MIGEYAIGATASIRAATSYTPDMDIEALFRRADAALYRAKHEGRKRLYADEGEPPPRRDAVRLPPHAALRRPSRCVRRNARGMPGVPTPRVQRRWGQLQRLVYHPHASMRGWCT